MLFSLWCLDQAIICRAWNPDLSSSVIEVTLKQWFVYCLDNWAFSDNVFIMFPSVFFPTATLSYHSKCSTLTNFFGFCKNMSKSLWSLLTYLLKVRKGHMLFPCMAYIRHPDYEYHRQHHPCGFFVCLSWDRYTYISPLESSPTLKSDCFISCKFSCPQLQKYSM